MISTPMPCGSSFMPTAVDGGAPVRQEMKRIRD